MTISATCGNCRFSTMASDAQGKINFKACVCKWGPPATVIISTPQGMIQNSMWPTLGVEAHCFRHEPVALPSANANASQEQPTEEKVVS